MIPLRPTQEAFNAVALLIRLGLVALGTLLLLRAVYILIGRIERAIRAEARGGAQSAREKRARTIGGVLKSIARAVILLIGILMGARELGLDITPLLAAAGGFGVAAGLGAQSVVRDWIAGFFIIRDDQFAVGDVIRAAGVSGTVEALSLRHTELRDSEGFIHFVPNGEIKVVTNLTKSWSTPIVRIPISLTEDPERVLGVVEGALARFREDARMKPLLLEGPRLLGIEDVGAGQFTILLQAKTVPEQRLVVARALRFRALERLRAEGIAIHGPVGADAGAAAPLDGVGAVPAGTALSPAPAAGAGTAPEETS
jgi:moderate conductance mechanosensitive channel